MGAKLEGIESEYTDLTVAEGHEGVPKLKETVRRSYEEVATLGWSPYDETVGRSYEEVATLGWSPYDETVERRQEQVRALLDGLEPRAVGSWEAKVRDPNRCGLVKAVCQSEGSFEWVEPRWNDAYTQRGRAVLGMGVEELEELN